MEKTKNIKLRHLAKKFKPNELNFLNTYHKIDEFKNDKFKNTTNYDNLSTTESKYKTTQGFYSNNKIDEKNNIFNTQIKINEKNESIYKESKYQPLELELEKINFNLTGKFKNKNNDLITEKKNNLESKNKNKSYFNSTSIDKENKNGFDKKNSLINKETLNKFYSPRENYFDFSKCFEHRIKTYKVELINNWHEKNQIPNSNFDRYIVKNLEFQSNNIIDQMKVLLDNVNYFKIQYLLGKQVLKK